MIQAVNLVSGFQEARAVFCGESEPNSHRVWQAGYCGWKASRGSNRSSLPLLEYLLHAGPHQTPPTHAHRSPPLGWLCLQFEKLRPCKNVLLAHGQWANKLDVLCPGTKF